MQNGDQYLHAIGNRLAALSDFEIFIGWVVVLCLSTYLVLKHVQRIRRQLLLNRQRELDLTRWSGKPIDVSKLKPTIEGVRLNHLNARGPRRGLSLHRGLLALARRAVTRLAYFQAKELESHPGSERP